MRAVWKADCVAMQQMSASVASQPPSKGPGAASCCHTVNNVRRQPLMACDEPFRSGDGRQPPEQQLWTTLVPFSRWHLTQVGWFTVRSHAAEALLWETCSTAAAVCHNNDRA
jgi:hypothetical protein